MWQLNSWFQLVSIRILTIAYSFLCLPIQDWQQAHCGTITNAVSLVCYLGNKRVVMAWGVWTCPTWERMRLFPDAEGLLCTLASACLRPDSTTPLYSQFYTEQPTPLYISQEVDKYSGHRKKGEMKDISRFDNISKAFIPFSPLERLSLGVAGFETISSRKGSSWIVNLSSAIIAQPTLLLLSCMHL